MTPKLRWAALAAVPWLLASPLAAQPGAGCFDSVRVNPEGFAAARDLISVTFEGTMGMCSLVRVAAIGGEEMLGPPFEHTINIVVAKREPALPDFVCPSPGQRPFTLVAHLPHPLFQNNPHDGPHVIGLYLRDEDGSGKLLSLRECGEVAVYVEQSSRDTATLHDGRFEVSVSWKRPPSQGIGRVVPTVHEPPVETALFWFFEPSNWELMVKVIDGCAFNGHWWTLGAAATDVEFTLRIRDTVGVPSTVWTHRNLPGVLAPAFADVRAFPCTAAASLP